MKYIVTILLTALVVGLGVTAYFKGWIPLANVYTPQAVSVQNTEISDVPLVNSPLPSAVSASTAAEVENKQTILAAVKVAFIAKHGPDFSDLNYSISKVENSYASGLVNGSGGGGMWFAAKVNGSWVIVSDGNGVILCSDLVSYPNFPKDMIPECWDTSTDKLIKR